MNTEIGQRIKQLRTDKKLSQREAAKLAGLTQACWSTLESGKRNGGVGTLKKIAQALGVTTSYLISGTDGDNGA